MNNRLNREGLISRRCVWACVCVPHGVCGPVWLDWCGECRAGTHQHGAVDVCCHHQDAEENGANYRPLQAKIVRSTCDRQACEVRMAAPDKKNKHFIKLYYGDEH